MGGLRGGRDKSKKKICLKLNEMLRTQTAVSHCAYKDYIVLFCFILYGMWIYLFLFLFLFVVSVVTVLLAPLLIMLYYFVLLINQFSISELFFVLISLLH